MAHQAVDDLEDDDRAYWFVVGSDEIYSYLAASVKMTVVMVRMG